MTQIYIIRHGEAEGNIFRRLHGQYDSLLTPRGHRQVEAVRKRFGNIPIDGCFSSDLTRTSLTARSIYIPKGLKLHRDPRFREVNVGIWEDVPYGYLDTFEARGMWEFNYAPEKWRVENSETFDDYTQRFLEGMREAAERFDGGTIAIFAHGAVIRGTLMRLFFRNNLDQLPYSDNTGVCKLRYGKGQISYEYLNDNSHVPEALSTFYIQRWWRQNDRRKESAVYFRDGEAPVPMPGGGATRVAMLIDRPVGAVVLGDAENGIGKVLGIDLLPDYRGRYYGDQLLGEAVSHFRHLGCRQVCLDCGGDPDGIFERYEFDPLTRCMSIDTTVFDWTGDV